MTRTLVVGDVHGCATALDALVRRARPDRLLLLGDLFTKGPEPRRVWDLIRELQPACILGNHDAKMLAVWDMPGTGKVSQAVAALPAEVKDWIGTLPLFWHGHDGEREVIAVHGGLHPTLGQGGTDARMAILLRRWPDDVDLHNPFWWQLWKGEERVIYGHDAMRGLQVHDRTVGLDTGCCYGHALSGYILENREVLQVSPDGASIDPPRPFHTDFRPGP